MSLNRVVQAGVCYMTLAVSAFSQPHMDWSLCTDKEMRVTFRYPKGWKTSPVYADRTYFEGPDGSVQINASDGDSPLQVCQGDAAHHLQPYGSHPKIQSMEVQGHKACLVWPSAEQGASAGAELVVAYPQPLQIDGNRYRQLTLYADKNHILDIMRTVRFISPRSK